MKAIFVTAASILIPFSVQAQSQGCYMRNGATTCHSNFSPKVECDEYGFGSEQFRHGRVVADLCDDYRSSLRLLDSAENAFESCKGTRDRCFSSLNSCTTALTNCSGNSGSNSAILSQCLAAVNEASANHNACTAAFAKNAQTHSQQMASLEAEYKQRLSTLKTLSDGQLNAERLARQNLEQNRLQLQATASALQDNKSKLEASIAASGTLVARLRRACGTRCRKVR